MEPLGNKHLADGIVGTGGGGLGGRFVERYLMLHCFGESRKAKALILSTNEKWDDS